MFVVEGINIDLVLDKSIKNHLQQKKLHGCT